MGMVNGQIGGISNVAKDTVTGTLNGFITIPEVAFNALGQATLPGEPGYVSFPKFTPTGKTGSLQDDIEMMAPVLLGVRGGAVNTGEITASAAIRAEAASNIWQARKILAETLPDKTIAERNGIIKAFELESFRVNTTTSPINEFRYFDGLPGGANINGRWSTYQWFETPAERITNLALPNNQATRAATVTIQPGTTVFRGIVAPQYKFSPDLIGGGFQSYNAIGPRAVIKEIP